MELRDPPIGCITGPDRTGNRHGVEREEGRDPLPGTQVFDQVQDQSKHNTAEECRGKVRVGAARKDEKGDRQERCKGHPEKQYTGYGVGQTFIARMDHVSPQGLIQPADKWCEYDAADLADHPCNSPDPKAAWFFHLDVWQNGASAGTSAEPYNQDRIRRQQYTAKNQCTQNSKRDMVPCDHGIVLRKIFPGDFGMIPYYSWYMFVCACVHWCETWTTNI